MSRHEGISCDSCLKRNFKEKRYKCLRCYDYDLCAVCYEAGSATARHVNQHPVQCILTREDCKLYFGGSTTKSDAYTCPYCGKMGFTEILLMEHVSIKHSHPQIEVLCPVCAVGRVSRSNVFMEDLLEHLNLEHRNTSNDLIAFFDEHQSRSSVRRVPLPTSRSVQVRGRRTNVHIGASGIVTGQPRNVADPITEFLTQLTLSGTQVSAPMPVERQNSRAGRQKDNGPKSNNAQLSNTHQPAQITQALSNSAQVKAISAAEPLLPKLLKKQLKEKELERMEKERSRRAEFTRRLVLSMMKTVDLQKTKALKN